MTCRYHRASLIRKKSSYYQRSFQALRNQLQHHFANLTCTRWNNVTQCSRWQKKNLPRPKPTWRVSPMPCVHQPLGDRLLSHHQSHKIDTSFCKQWHIHPRKAKVIIFSFAGWKKSIPLLPKVEIGSLFVITQSHSYATFQRLQGKVICLRRLEADLGKPAPGWSMHGVRGG